MPSREDAKIIYTGPSSRGWHRLQQAAECLQKYAWTYVAPKDPEGTKGPKGTALARGSLMHLALAQHYARMKAKQNGLDPEDWCDPVEAVQLIAKMEKTEEPVEDVLRTYEAYQDRYWSDEQELKILEIEHLAQTMIGGKYLLTGRFDLVIEDLSGKVFVVDHKTTGFMKAAQKEFYAVSGQLLGYSHMARERYGDRFGGMKLNIVQVGSKPAFDRTNLARSPYLEQRFVQSVIDIEESIERMEASGRMFDDWPKSINELTCYHRYGACEFIDQCRFGAGFKKGGNWTWGG